MGMDKCLDCEHRGKGDLDECLRCHGVAPMRVHVALFLAVLLLFFMAVAATGEALTFRQTGEGPVTKMIRQHASAAPDKGSVAASPSESK